MGRILFSVFLGLLLTGCGGGGGGGGGSTTPTPVITNPPPGNNAVLVSLSISPSSPRALKIGQSMQFYAIGTYSDGGQADLTGSIKWAGGSNGRVSVSSTGLVKALSLGSDNISVQDSTGFIYASALFYTSTYGLEGSVDSPVVLTTGQTHAGEVNFGGTGKGNGYSYYVVNVTPGAHYYALLTGLSDNANLEIYDDSGFTNAICHSINYGKLDEKCYAKGPAGGKLYIAVNGDDVTSIDYGAKFNLIVQQGFGDEGTQASPIALSLNTPHQGQTGTMVYDNITFSYLMHGLSYYQVPVAITGRYTFLVESNEPGLSMTVISGSGSGTILCYPTTVTPGTQSCELQAKQGLIYVWVEAKTSLVGASHTLTVTENHGAYSNEGTVAAPMNLSGKLPYTGQATSTSYYSYPVNAMQSYEIRASNMDGSLSMRVYDGDASYTTSVCSLSSNGTTDMVCRLEPVKNGMLYLALSANTSGTQYQLSVTPINYPAEGTVSAPKVFTTTPVFNGTPYAGTVDSTTSFYQVPVVAGKLYQANVSNVSGDISLTVYSNSSFTTQLCTSNNAGLVKESCQFTPAGSNVWIAIGGDTYGSKFTMTVDRVYVHQGSLSLPLDITSSLPAYSTGEVGFLKTGADHSYYKVNLAAGKSYVFTVTNSTDNSLVMDVYDNNPTYSYPMDCSASKSSGFSCTVKPLYGSTAYIRMTSYDPYGAGFGISISELGFSAKGSVTTPVNMGSFPKIESVGTARLELAFSEVDSTSSYYVADISGGYDYVNYMVSLVNQSADVDLYVYDDAAFSNLLCSSVAAGTANEACKGLAPVGNKLYIRVSGETNGFGGTFGLWVDHDYKDEGGVSTGNGGSLKINAVPLTLGVPYQGQTLAGSPNSYYYLSGFAPGTYTITVSNIFDSICTWAYDEVDGKYTTFYVAYDTNMFTGDKTLTFNYTNGLFIAINACGSTVTGSAYTITIN